MSAEEIAKECERVEREIRHMTYVAEFLVTILMLVCAVMISI